MIRETFPVGLLGCNCTILADEQSRKAIVVDPGDDIPRILATLAAHQLTVAKIVITHAHFDHIAAAGQLRDITGAPVMYNQADLPLAAMIESQPTWVGLSWKALAQAAPAVLQPDHSPADAETLRVGDLEATVLCTPGHTPGSISLHIPAEKIVIAGDTLFAGSVGRSDFPLGNGPELLESIRERILTLPADTTVVPGHGPDTTVAHEARTNPFLR